MLVYPVCTVKVGAHKWILLLFCQRFKMKEGKNIQIIEWQDLDKKKFFGVGMIFSGLLRFTLYPTNLVKTRLQASDHVGNWIVLILCYPILGLILDTGMFVYKLD